MISDKNKISACVKCKTCCSLVQEAQILCCYTHGCRIVVVFCVFGALVWSLFPVWLFFWLCLIFSSSPVFPPPVINLITLTCSSFTWPFFLCFSSCLPHCLCHFSVSLCQRAGLLSIGLCGLSGSSCSWYVWILLLLTTWIPFCQCQVPNTQVFLFSCLWYYWLVLSWLFLLWAADFALKMSLNGGLCGEWSGPELWMLSTF